VAAREVEDASFHPYIQAAFPLVEKLKKYEAYCDLQTTLSSQSPSFGQIKCRQGVSREEFLQQFFSQNCPVVLTDLMHDWRALTLWTPQYLKEKFANEIIEIQVDRSSDPRYEENSNKHKKKISFGEYADMVVNGGESNDYYMTANNHVIETGEMKR